MVGTECGLGQYSPTILKNIVYFSKMVGTECGLGQYSPTILKNIVYFSKIVGTECGLGQYSPTILKNILCLFFQDSRNGMWSGSMFTNHTQEYSLSIFPRWLERNVVWVNVHKPFSRIFFVYFSKMVGTECGLGQYSPTILKNILCLFFQDGRNGMWSGSIFTNHSQEHCLFFQDGRNGMWSGSIITYLSQKHSLSIIPR